MTVGIIFKSIDRIIPTVAEKRAQFSEILAKIQAEMDKDPFTLEQIEAYKASQETISKYRFFKNVLASSSFKLRYGNFEISSMLTFVNNLESDPSKLGLLKETPSFEKRINRFLECKKYIENGISSFGDAKLETFLNTKRASSYMRHDPIDAFTADRIGPRCDHAKMYGVIFEGLSIETARAFCEPDYQANGVDDEGFAVYRMRRVRKYRLAFALLPAPARVAVEEGLIPALVWNPAYMVLKNG